MATMQDLKSVLDSIDNTMKNQSLLMAQNFAEQNRQAEKDRASRTTPNSGGLLAGAGSLAAGAGGLATGGGNLLGGLGKGIGFAGAGIGAALLGLSTVIDQIPDADAVKESVETLLTIGDGYESKLDFFMDGGTLSIILTGLGIGLAAFAIGSGANAAVKAAVEKFEVGDWAETVKSNVNTLLSIGDDKALGALQVLGEGGAITIALTGLGIGLAAFATGSGAAAAVDYFSKDSNWAENVKSNVNTLLSIGDDKALGALQVLGEGAGVSLALAGLGVGLVAFSAGQGVSAAVEYFADDEWAEKVKSNVETLLSISNIEGIGWDTAGFIGVMAGLASGLTVFALGKGADTIVEGADQALNFFTGESDFAQRIYDQVETLLKIPNIDGIGSDVTGFIAAMVGISSGLAAFALGKGASTAVEGADQALSYFTGEDDFAQRIYDNVSKLMEVVDLVDGGEDTSKAGKFALGLAKISAGLIAFTAADVIGQLAGAGQELLNFFGVSSPFEKILEISEQSTELEKGADAIEKIANALNVFGTVGTAKMNIDFEALAENLGKSIPLLQGLANGGVVGEGWFSGGIDFGKGILDPSLKLDEIADKIAMVKRALSLDLNTETDTMAAVDTATSISNSENMPLIESLSERMLTVSENIVKGLELLERSIVAAPIINYAPVDARQTQISQRGGDNQTAINSFGGANRSDLSYGSVPGGIQPF